MMYLDKKIKSIPLKVSAPFHCSMKPADKMEEKINNINFLKPFEIINNVNANSETNPESLKNLLVKQIFTTVKWRESIIKMSDNNVKISLKLVQEKPYLAW